MGQLTKLLPGVNLGELVKKAEPVASEVKA